MVTLDPQPPEEESSQAHQAIAISVSILTVCLLLLAALRLQQRHQQSFLERKLPEAREQLW